MKKIAFVTCFYVLAVLSGCANNGADNRDLYQKNGNTINVNTKRNELYNEGSRKSIRNVSTDYGYVRYQKSPVMGNKDNNNYYASLNREQVANIISRYSTGLPNVHDAATLVTDQEVLIAYRTDSKDRNLTADQVKHTAFSVVPRYYHVYVTDNTGLIRDIENLSHMDSTSNSARRNIASTIAKMKKSPQGKPLSKIENANGETQDDVILRPHQ